MDELLHCPKCRERFGEDEHKPKLLQCHHTYCLRCLQALQSKQGGSKKATKSITCPTCSKVTSVGKKGASSLQDNFYITTFRSTLEMQASETESAVDDIYVSDEEEEDLPEPAGPPQVVDDWCKQCKRVVVPSCVALKHDMCNLLKMIEGLLAQYGDLVVSQVETREPVLHSLQAAELALFAVLHGLQEDVSSQDMLLSMARSERQWLLAIDLANKTTSALSDRFGKLDLQVSAAVGQLERAKATSNNFLGLARAALTLDFAGPGEERQSVTLDVGGDTDNEKALRYLLYKMMQARKLSVPDAKPEEEDVTAETEEWKVVGSEKSQHKVDLPAPLVQTAPTVPKMSENLLPPTKQPLTVTATSLPASFTKAPQISVHSVDTEALAAAGVNHSGFGPQPPRSYIEQNGLRLPHSYVVFNAPHTPRTYGEQNTQQPPHSYSVLNTPQTPCTYPEQNTQQPSRTYGEQNGLQQQRTFTEQTAQQPSRTYGEQNGLQQPHTFTEQNAQQPSRTYADQNGLQQPRTYAEQNAPQTPRGYTEQNAPQTQRGYTEQNAPQTPRTYTEHNGLQAWPAVHHQETVSKQQPAERKDEPRLVSVKSLLSTANSYQCFFEMEVNGKSIGTVVMKLRPDVAPKMCSNFVSLCRGDLGYGYKGSKIFKVCGNSFVVGGDFVNDDGTGGYSIYNKGYFLGDDCNLPDSCGAVRMRGMGTDPKTGGGKVGSQFHFWVGEKEYKEYRKTLVFGHVVRGLEILQHISNFKTIRNSEGEYILKSSVVIRNCGTL